MSRSLCTRLAKPTGRHLLHRLQRAAPVHSSAGDGLVSWVACQGGLVMPGLHVVPLGADEGYSLRIFQDVSQGTPLIRLPPCCHLSAAPATSPPGLTRLSQYVPEELWGARLALQVLYHRLQGPSSLFSTYIENLPLGFSGLPIFFSQDAVEALAYPPIAEQVKKRGRWLYTFSRDVLAKLPGQADDPFGGSVVDLNALGWAFACVTSRAFRLKDRDPCMLPLIDMCNHSLDPNCDVVLDKDGSVSLCAKRKLDAGEALDISYGPLGNDFLLLDYGFILPGNPHDRIQLRFDTSLIEAGLLIANSKQGSGAVQPIKLSPIKEKVLQYLNLVGKGANTLVEIGGPQLLDPRLLAGVRVALCKDESQLKKATTLQNLGSWAHPISTKSEVEVLSVLTGICAFSLASFPSTLDADLKLLADSNAPSPATGDSPAAASLSPDVQLAIRFRVECMKVLKSVLIALEKKYSQLVGDGACGAAAAAAGKVTSGKPVAKGFGPARPAARTK